MAQSPRLADSYGRSAVSSGRFHVRKKLLTVVLVLYTACLGMPAGVAAQTPGQSISGQVVDAGGRALINQRVELVRDGQVVQAATTGNRGEWTFASVAPGTYVVRVVINGQVSGVRVPVMVGQATANALIVVPSAAVASPVFLLPLISLLGTVGTIVGAAGIIAAITATTIAITAS
jgi:hypothetical protein